MNDIKLGCHVYDGRTRKTSLKQKIWARKFMQEETSYPWEGGCGSGFPWGDNREFIDCSNVHPFWSSCITPENTW